MAEKPDQAKQTGSGKISVNNTSDSTEPVCVTFADVSAAPYRIRDGVPQTPCELSKMSESLGMKIYFKKDYLLHTGSFKERGARNTLVMLSQEQKNKGVIAASAGNHALALSYHGQQLSIPVTVVMPVNAPINKIASCRKYGANVHVQGSDLIDSKDIALKICKENGLQYINGYDHPHILAGAGTMGLEIMEQVKNADAVIIPVGGGGLIAGVAVAVKKLNPNTKIYGVESERCPSFTAALEAGKPVTINANQSMTLADGLCVSKVGSNAYHTAHQLIDRMITVSEKFIAQAILRLVEEEKATIEGAGATGLAACLGGLVPELQDKTVVIALCGGNIDSSVLGRCLERGLAADGRLVRFVVTISDRPGGDAELTRLVANTGASVKEIFHERAWLASSIFSVQVKIIAELRDRDHGNELKEALQSKYGKELIWDANYEH